MNAPYLVIGGGGVVLPTALSSIAEGNAGRASCRVATHLVAPPVDVKRGGEVHCMVVRRPNREENQRGLNIKLFRSRSHSLLQLYILYMHGCQDQFSLESDQINSLVRVCAPQCLVCLRFEYTLLLDYCSPVWLYCGGEHSQVAKHSVVAPSHLHPRINRPPNHILSKLNPIRRVQTNSSVVIVMEGALSHVATKSAVKTVPEGNGIARVAR